MEDQVAVIEANSVRFLKVRRRTGEDSSTLKKQDLERIRDLISRPWKNSSEDDVPRKPGLAPSLVESKEDVEDNDVLFKSYRHEEIQKEAKEIVEHALELRVAREDAVKEADRLTLALKCQALRDVQVEARDSALKKDRIEELMMDDMMEKNQKQLFEVEEAAQKERKRLWREQGVNLDKQAVELERRRDREIRRVEREWEVERRRAEEAAADVSKEKEARQKKKKVVASELARSYQLAVEAKERAKEREKEEDAKIARFLAEKARQEEEQEKQKIRRKKEKENNLKELEACALQHKLRDRGYNLSLLRAEEQADREWRQKEKDRLEQKKKLRQELLEGQKELPRRRQRALEARIAEEKVAVVEAAKKIAAARALDKEEEKESKEKIQKYHRGLQEQMLENEERYLKGLVQETRAAAVTAEAAREHEKRIRETVQQKIQELAENQQMPRKHVALMKSRMKHMLENEAK